MKSKSFKTLKYKKQIILFSTLFLISKPAYAYAGPGVAIGALVVFLTVIIAFFASFFISLFRFIIKSSKFIINFLFNKRNKKLKQSKKEEKSN